MLERAGSAGREGRAAFTLIELLIAVGALALVSVGVAAIFEATGKTVQTGRRVSAMTSYANLIERRMREDFASMTRDGFLIIKNIYAVGQGSVNSGSYPNILAQGVPNPDAVPLSDADEHPGLRRIDEIMFFVKGQFVSARDLLDGRFVAKSDAAAIYYGHGQKSRLQPYTATEPGYWPSVGDPPNDPNARLGYQYMPAAGQPENPNRYASDWILVRNVTLLRPAQTSILQSTPVPIGMNQAQMKDSDTQVALQPAESNLFRWLSHLSFGPVATGSTVRSSFDNAMPQRDSGLVDIVTTDLGEIKAIITTADTWPGGGAGMPAGPNFFKAANNSGPDGNNAGVDGKSRPQSADVLILGREQAWMNDALPAGSTISNVLNRRRIRCESAPVNYVGVVGSGLTEPELSSRRADQIMLSASNFLPHCTEFIVEWSFGAQFPSDPAAANYNPDRAGELVWHGMKRDVNGKTVTNFYMANQFPWDQPVSVDYTRVDGTVVSRPAGDPANYPEIIHGAGFSIAQQGSNPADPLTSYFGYTDPTFNPDMDAPTGSTVPDGKLISPRDSRSPTIPWPWPKFIRITMSLADPNNPLVEQSFQFVFDVPAAQ